MDALSVFLHGSSPVLAAVKEHEMEIGCPTDVKHVVHIGWDSAAGGASPSWMNDIMASSDLSSLGNFAALTGTSWVSQVARIMRMSWSFALSIPLGTFLSNFYGSYIHDSRIGVLIEVNCETDFVSRGDIFKELVDDLALQIAACPQVQYISIDDVPEEVVKKETELEMQREDLLTKPEQVQAKIVEGRVKKRLGELTLFEQPFIKNDKVTISEWLKQTIGTTGENMKVRRFARYNLDSQEDGVVHISRTAGTPNKVYRSAFFASSNLQVQLAASLCSSN
ncbi:elongation factor Ts family protein [Zea mays]|uniref:Elongation factor Ts, mitochondrial n=1 Tax=Zea mays TaxID=4577 RepID=A0A1D6MTR8_MAIZE|nr:elongation factor Ts family protein [Zea mays]